MVDRHGIIDLWKKNIRFRPFFDPFSNIMDQKMPQAKKVINMKNQFFYAHQPPEEIFDVCSNGYCIFTIEVFFQNGRRRRPICE